MGDSSASNGFFIHEGSCSITHWTFEKNIISLGYVDLPNADTFHYIRLKTPRFLTVTTDLIGKDLKPWGAIKFMVARTHFHNSNFQKKVNFYHWPQICRWFSLK